MSVPGTRLDVAPCLGANGLGHSALAVTAAVSPLDLVLHPVQQDLAGGAGGAAGGAAGRAWTGVVTSALYGPHGFDVSADWQGRTLRAHVTGWVPKPGDRVMPEVLRAHVFAAEASGAAGEADRAGGSGRSAGGVGESGGVAPTGAAKDARRTLVRT